MTEHDLVDAPPHQVAGDSALQSQTLESVAVGVQLSRLAATVE